MGEKGTLFTKGSVTKNQTPISQPDKKNSSRSNRSSINRILALQKAAGNKAVQVLLRTCLLQTKLKIGKPNDKYEQEADKIAEKVMKMPMPDVDQIAWQGGQEDEKSGAKKLFAQANTFLLKKHEDDEEEAQSIFMPQSKSEEEEIESMPLIHREEAEMEEKVHAKLFIRRQEETEKGEEEEEEIQTKPFIQQQQEESEEEEKEEEEVQTKPLIQLQQEGSEKEEEEEEEIQTKSFIQKQQEESEEENEEEEEEVQAKELSGHTPGIPLNIEMDINNIKGGGQPLSFGTREFFEPRFGYDFSRVKVHTDSRSANASENIHARAFTIGHDIFFGKGQYKPEKTAGRHLIAHELTHVVQQGGGRALKRSEIVSRLHSHPYKSERSLVQRESNEKGGEQSGQLYRKLGPLNIDRVNDSKVVRGGFFDWVVKKGSAAIRGVKKLGSKIKKGITALAGNLIKKAKEYIADKVKNVPGYELATYILGKDPITQKKASKKSGGFLKLIFKLLGAEETYDRLVESKVVKKAYSLLSNAFQRAKLTWGFIVKSIKGIWAFLTKNPLGLIKALGMAKDFFFSLVSKAIQVGKNVITEMPLLILEGFLVLVGAPVKRIMGIINKGKEVILLIANNPIKFVGRLVGALKKGFFQFKDNIWKHLKAGLLSWLFGTLQKAGINMPEKFDMKGIFSLVMQILGITYARIREKVVKVIGEKNMQRLEKAWEFIKALMTGGMGALWEKIKESLGSLKDMVIGAIKNWVVTKIVVSAISKLASMFNPVGAIIQAALTIYNTIMFFIERAKQIAALVEAVFNSITDIAYGKITAAANWIEKTMARSIPVILGFLARFLNLGGIAEKIKKVIGKIQEKVDRAIDKVINFIVEKAKVLFGKAKVLFQKGVKKLKGLLIGKKETAVPVKSKKESHTLWFEIDQDNAKLMIASESTKNVLIFLSSLEKRIPKDKKELINELNTLKGKCQDHEKKAKGVGRILAKVGTKEGVSAIKGKTEGIKKKLKKQEIEIADALIKLLDKIADIKIYPPFKITEKIVHEANGYEIGGKHVKAIGVSLPTVKGMGSSPSIKWDFLNKIISTRGGEMKPYVRGHLLNDHLGGPGNELFNLTPITGKCNKEMSRKLEEPAKKAILSEDKIANISVDVEYGGHEKGSNKPDYLEHLLCTKIVVMVDEIDSNYNPINTIIHDRVEHKLPPPP